MKKQKTKRWKNGMIMAAQFLVILVVVIVLACRTAALAGEQHIFPYLLRVIWLPLLGLAFSLVIARTGLVDGDHEGTEE